MAFSLLPQLVFRNLWDSSLAALLAHKQDFYILLSICTKRNESYNQQSCLGREEREC